MIPKQHHMIIYHPIFTLNHGLKTHISGCPPRGHDRQPGPTKPPRPPTVPSPPTRCRGQRQLSYPLGTRNMDTTALLRRVILSETHHPRGALHSPWDNCRPTGIPSGAHLPPLTTWEHTVTAPALAPFLPLSLRSSSRPQGPTQTSSLHTPSPSGPPQSMGAPYPSSSHFNNHVNVM